MLAPNAEQIESAKDQINKLPAWIVEAQQKELRSAIGDVNLDFSEGYSLGLQTARLVISQSMAVQLAGVKPNDVL